VPKVAGSSPDSSGSESTVYSGLAQFSTALQEVAARERPIVAESLLCYSGNIHFS
jgi:hypothetical protein